MSSFDPRDFTSVPQLPLTAPANWRNYTNEAFKKNPKDSRDEDEEGQGRGRQKQYNTNADSAIWSDGRFSNDHPALNSDGSDTSRPGIVILLRVEDPEVVPIPIRV